MPLPLIPIGIASLGIGAGLGLGSLLDGGGKKGGMAETHAFQEHYAPTITDIYAPQIQYSPVTGYAYTGATYIVQSPGAVSKKETSIDQESKPRQEGAWDIPITPSRSQAETSGTSMTTLAVIAVIGVLGYAIISKKGGK